MTHVVLAPKTSVVFSRQTSDRPVCGRISRPFCTVINSNVSRHLAGRGRETPTFWRETSQPTHPCRRSRWGGNNLQSSILLLFVRNSKHTKAKVMRVLCESFYSDSSIFDVSILKKRRQNGLFSRLFSAPLSVFWKPTSSARLHFSTNPSGEFTKGVLVSVTLQVSKKKNQNWRHTAWPNSPYILAGKCDQGRRIKYPIG